MLFTIFIFIITYIAPILPFIDFAFSIRERFTEKKEKNIQLNIETMNGDITINNQSGHYLNNVQRLKKEQHKLNSLRRNKQYFQKHSSKILLISLIVSFVLYFGRSLFPLPDIPFTFTNFDIFINHFSKALYYSFVMSSKTLVYISLAICFSSLMKNLFIDKKSFLKKFIAFLYFPIVFYFNLLLLNHAYNYTNLESFNIKLSSEKIQDIFSQTSPPMLIFLILVNIIVCSLLVSTYFETTIVTIDLTSSVPIIGQYIGLFLLLFFTAWYFTPESMPFSLLTPYLPEWIEQIKATFLNNKSLN